MSDISFLLLAFFLMVSNINTDMGIRRQLPPLQEQQKPKDQEINRRNIFVVKINSHDRLLYNGELGSIYDLRERAKTFLSNPNNLPSLPEKRDENIPLLGRYQVSKGVISLQNDRGTSYDMYLKVQNELTAAVNELRDDLSVSKFGKNYADLDKEHADAINKAIPVSISEAEQTKIGDKK